MSKIDLTATQRGRAEQLKDDLDSERVTSPQDIQRVRPWTGLSWKKITDQRDYNATDPANHENVRKEINPNEIAGVISVQNPKPDFRIIDRLEKDRLRKVLNWLLEGEFDTSFRESPDYVEFDGNYYIANDGIHRSIACKAVNVDRLTGEVTIV